eukprot:1610583-Amphidinium_carterae.1
MESSPSASSSTAKVRGSFSAAATSSVLSALVTSCSCSWPPHSVRRLAWDCWERPAPSTRRKPFTKGGKRTPCFCASRHCCSRRATNWVRFSCLSRFQFMSAPVNARRS